MKKTLAAGVFAFFCLSTALSAFSWSGLVNNESKFIANNDFSKIELQQTNGVYLSFAAPRGDGGNMKLTGEGLVKGNFGVPIVPNEGEASSALIADCDLFKFSGVWGAGSGVVALNAGRFRMSDVSGSVFSQVSDGLSVSYNALKFKAGLYAGYTGLLNAYDVSMISVPSGEAQKVYTLCPAYIPVMVDFSYKTLLETNTIGIQGAFFMPVDTEKNDMKAYGTLYLSGPVSTVGTYNITGTVGLLKLENLMLDAKADFNYFIGNFGMINIGAEYVSGESDSIHAFVPVTARTLYNGTLSSGLILPKVGFMIAKNSMYLALTEKVVIAMLPEETGMDGFDTSLSFVCNVLSDVQVGCDADAYICTKDSAQSNYYLTIKASLAF